MKLKKKYLVIIGLVILIAGFGYYQISKSKSKTSTGTQETTTVSYGTIVTSVSGTGSLAPLGSASVNAPSYGIIDKIFVANGDSVKTGAPLFHFKSLAQATEIAKARAASLSAKASVISAQQLLQDATANEQILNKNLNGSQLNYQAALIDAQKSIKDAQKNAIDASNTSDSVKNNLDILSAQIDAASADLALNSSKIKAKESIVNAQSALAQAKRDTASAVLKKQAAEASFAAAQANAYSAALSYAELSSQIVTAPIEGTVANTNIQVGSIVGQTEGSSSSTSSNTGSSSDNTALLSVINKTKFSVTVAISEVDIPSIKNGQPAIVTFDAFPDKSFTGSVTNVDSVGTTTSGVTTYNVQVILDNVDESLRPGMSASSSIITNRKEHVLLVPNGAIQNQNNQTFVNVVKNGTTVSTAVTIGLSNELETEITSGIYEGDTVATGTTTQTKSSSSSGVSLFGGNQRSGGLPRGF